MLNPMQPCPCTSGHNFGSCCGPYIEGERHADTASALMRSRYSAYTLHHADYLLATWHPSTRPASLDFDPQTQWMRLELAESSQGEPGDTTGTVFFTAHFISGKQLCTMSEKSQFRQENGKWFYIDGICEMTQQPLHRSSSCPCGSGKKYKRCCLNRSIS